MPIDGQTSDRPKLTLFGMLWRTAAVLFTLLIVVGTIGGYFYLSSRRQALAELKAIVDQIRTKQEPLTGAEIDAFYAIPDGDEDLTAEYLAAIQGFENSKPPPEIQQLFDAPNQETIPRVGQSWKERPTAESFLATHQVNLDKLRELAKRKGSVRYPIKLRDGFSALLPAVAQLRAACRHLQFEFFVRLHQGDRAGAIASVHAIFRVGETLRKEPLLISQLVRISIFRIGGNCVTQLLRDQQVTEVELAALAEMLDEIDFTPSLGTAMLGERATGYSTLESKQSLAGMTGTSDFPDLSRFGTLLELRPGDAAYLLELETELVDAAKLPLPAAIAKFKQITDRLDRERKAEERYLPWNRKFLAHLLVPAVNSVSEAIGNAQAIRNSLRTAVAVEQYRLQHEKHPASLAELVPDFLSRELEDPFVGRPLRYLLSEHDYTIYSLGNDLIDDGGDVVYNSVKYPDTGITIQFADPPKEP